MWRLHLFLLLSTCFLIPHDAKPMTRTKTTTNGLPPTTTLASLLLETESTTEGPSTSPRTSSRFTHIGRLAAKDLADLLLASMQARGAKLSSFQESTMKMLRTEVSKEVKGNNMFLQLGMDVIIDILIGARNEATCSHIIRDIEQSQDRNSLTLTLRSFLALLSFNGIACSQDEVSQAIKSSLLRQRQQPTIKAIDSEQQETEGSGIRSARKVDSTVKDDRDSVLQFLQARSLDEHSTILNTLLQVCGASAGEAHKIIRNLREMGPESTTTLQVNAFSMLSVSMLDSLSSIADGNTSGLCSASPATWIVRLLAMKVGKVVLLGLMTALDNTLVSPTPTETANAMALNSVNGGDITDFKTPLGSKASITAKRASSSPVDLLSSNSLGNVQNVATGTNIEGTLNKSFGLAKAVVPVNADVDALSDATSGTNTQNIVAGTNVKGVENTATNAVQALVPVNADVDALTVGTGGSGSTQNVQAGSNLVGSGNTANGLVRALVPVNADVDALDTVNGDGTGTNQNVQDPTTIIGDGNQSSDLVRALIPANADANVLTGLKDVGINTQNVQSGTFIKGNKNTRSELVGVLLPVQATADALSNVDRTTSTGSTGSSGSSGSTGSSGSSGTSSGTPSSSGSSGSTGSGSTGSGDLLGGNKNTLTELISLNAPIAIVISLLSTILGGGFGNNMNIREGAIMNGTGNSVIKGVSVTPTISLIVSVLSTVNPGGVNHTNAGLLGGLLGGSGGLLGGGLLSGGSSSSSGGLLGGLGGGSSSGGLLGNGLGGLLGGSGLGGLLGGVVTTVEGLLSTLLGGVLGTGLGSLLSAVLGGVLPPVISTVEQLLVHLISLLAGGTGITSGGTCIPSSNSTNSTAASNLSGAGGTSSSTGIGNSLNKSADVTILGNENTVVKLVSVDGTVLCSLFLLDSILGTGFIGNSANVGPKHIIVGNNNKIVKLVNLDIVALLFLSVGSIIRGSGGVCNQINVEPENEIVGDCNTVFELVDIDLNLLLDVAVLSQLIGSVANDCSATTTTTTTQPPTPQPPTPSPPTPSPPTPSPPTPSPPTPSPPTPYPPTNQPPTVQPPTVGPPTIRPPTVRPPSPNPNNCYRRYCRKWRTRPSYLCYKNCGGNFTYKP
ncbi:putative GPI-anchored protein pfl2 [Drosophila serrata]|uniref:putative GPI-anchored protein pfl2 n=1 Tax=Drosophila serrata TaxID=7274 RepID=UPI000A1D2ED2|nr:putative GPI-anchored protein pfl2 [Drosophila serrata]